MWLFARWENRLDENHWLKNRVNFRFYAFTPPPNTELVDGCQSVPIIYDASSLGKFQGLDPTGDMLQKWFPYIFVGVGAIIALSSAGTFLLRATQIGGGIYLINVSRGKDRERLQRKMDNRKT